MVNCNLLIRRPQRQQQKLSPQTFHNQRKIFTMDTSDQYLILGLQNNIIEIYDFKNLHHPLETRQVGLKYQIKDLKTFPDNQGFALSTIDGRINGIFQSDPQFHYKIDLHSNAIVTLILTLNQQVI